MQGVCIRAAMTALDLLWNESTTTSVGGRRSYYWAFAQVQALFQRDNGIVVWQAAGQQGAHVTAMLMPYGSVPCAAAIRGCKACILQRAVICLTAQ